VSGDGLTARIAAVRARVAAAAAKAGRDPASVRIMAVTKGHGRTRVEALRRAGFDLFGENRVQEARAKFSGPERGISLHLIGHLQTNKVKFALEIFQVVQSLDSLRLAEAIQQRARGRVVPVMVQVNAGREPQKFGLWPEAVPGFLEELERFDALSVVGLMAVMPITGDLDRLMADVEELWQRERMRQRAWAPLNELSMGSSNDFEQAIGHGSTIVRLGTVLVGERVGGRGEEASDEEQPRE
jgi:pyridoxal phosphate enzyme (YggS family)